MARTNQYKYMDEESVGPGLLCIICKKPFKDPRCTPCNHIFCRECITGQIESNRAPCPACGKLVSGDSLSMISRTLNKMLQALRVKCTVCGQTDLKRGNIDDHINKECPNVRVPCPSKNSQCPWIGQRNQLENHLSTCIFQPFPSVFSELFAENQQLKEQCRKQLDQIQKLEIESLRRKDEIERASQRSKQRKVQINKLTEKIADAAPPILPVPTPKIVTPPPIITANIVTDQKAILDVTPAWFDPVKRVSPDKIRLPANYNKNSPVDVRTYNCLSSYRSMMKKTDSIDFVKEPFLSTVDNTETLVVVLNELADQLGARLTFTHKDFQYNDSDYRTACGVTNLGSIHSFLASEGHFQTAKFNLHLKLNYNQLTASPESLRKFVLTCINDISTIAECNKDFIRIFSVSRDSLAVVGFGITTPKLDDTTKAAELVKQKLNHPSITQRQDIFQYLSKENYDYKLEPALAFLQLQESDFEPHYNRAYSEARTETRGGRPYYFPQGWYRHALKIVDKYPADQLWLGMNNSPGEWAVAYHGTKSDAVRGIRDKGLLHSLVAKDLMKEEAKRQNPSIPDVKGLYVATHCEGGASEYTSPFTIQDSTGKTKTYRVVFQCRVQPRKFTEHSGPVRNGMAWRVFDEKAIRPYGLLLKSS